VFQRPVAIIVLLIASAGVVFATDPVKYEQFPPEKLKAYKAIDGFVNVEYWNRDVNLQFTTTKQPGVGYMPSVYFNIGKNQKLPDIPDGGVPFALSLQGEGITDENMKAIAKLPNLIAVGLVGTKVTDDGIKELAASKSLKYFKTYGTKLSNAALKHLAACPTIEGIESTDPVYGAVFNDAGVKELAKLSKLQYLNLSHASLTDACLPTIAGFKNLTHLNLHSFGSLLKDVSPLAGLPKLTHLHVSIPTGDAAVKSLKGLKTLTDLSVSSGSVSGGNVTDEVFKLAQAFPELSVLSIHVAQVTDAGLKEVKNLPGLTVLDLTGCTRLTDAGMVELKNLPKLTHIDLWMVPITDKGLAELAQIKTLTQIQLADTKVTKAGCDAFKKARPECRVFGEPDK
jgi:hypothetical protein